MRVALIACGGTISGQADAMGRFRPADGAAELLERVALAPEIEVVAVNALSMPSRACRNVAESTGARR